MLLPYNGDRQTEHFASDGSPHTMARYASDQSGTRTYAFNSLGYRGEEYDRTADFRIFVCGASYAFGTGLDWEETWGYRLKLTLARRLGLDLAGVNLLNLSQSVASADYVTRTLITQCARVQPNLVVAHYSGFTRAEHLMRDGSLGLMPVRLNWLKRLWTLRPGWRRRLARWMPRATTRREAYRVLQAWEHYSGLFNAETGFMRVLTNVLLLQEFCRAREIECLISWTQHHKLFEARFARHAAIAPLIALLDWKRICPFSLADRELKLDLAADGIHPGPRSSRRFAECLEELYTKLAARKGTPSKELRAAS
jgi:hypothetical protein